MSNKKKLTEDEAWFKIEFNGKVFLFDDEEEFNDFGEDMIDYFAYTRCNTCHSDGVEIKESSREGEYYAEEVVCSNCNGNDWINY